MSRILTLGILIGGIAGACLATHRNALRRQSTAHTPHAAPVEVQTWEGEGGAVPVQSRNVREVQPSNTPSAMSSGSSAGGTGAGSSNTSTSTSTSGQAVMGSTG